MAKYNINLIKIEYITEKLYAHDTNLANIALAELNVPFRKNIDVYNALFNYDAAFKRNRNAAKHFRIILYKAMNEIYNEETHKGITVFEEMNKPSMTKIEKYILWFALTIVPLLWYFTNGYISFIIAFVVYAVLTGKMRMSREDIDYYNNRYKPTPEYSVDLYEKSNQNSLKSRV